MKEIASKHGLVLDDTEVHAGIMPDSAKSFLCRQWMTNHFDTSGDKIPNSDNEVTVLLVSLSSSLIFESCA